MLLRVTPGRMIPLSRGGVTSSLEIQINKSLIYFFGGEIEITNSLPAVPMVQKDE